LNQYRKLAAAMVCLAVLCGVLLFQSAARMQGDGVSSRSGTGAPEPPSAAGLSGWTVEIPGAQYARKSAESSIRTGELQGRDRVLIWDSAGGEVAYEVTVPESGVYHLYVEYWHTGDDAEAIERGLLIDGAVPESLPGTFVLGQRYRYDKYPFAKDGEGNEKRPKLLAVQAWMTEPVADKTGMKSAPIDFALEQGSHTITLTGVRGTLAIAKIILKTPESIPDYREYQANLPAHKSPAGFVQTIEGEQAHALSARDIQLYNIGEAGVVPEAYGKRAYNAIGGLSWRHPQQWVEWQFEVPEDGTYQIGIKYRQADNSDLSSYRTVHIDGKVPFQEMLHVSFPYAESWKNKVLGDDRPHEFYLAKGKHTIRLTVTSEPYAPVIGALREIADDIKRLDLEIKKITGVTKASQIDLFKSYDLKKYVPDIDAQLAELADRLAGQMKELARLTGSGERKFDALYTDMKRLRGYADHPDDIPKSVDSLTRIQLDVLNFAASLAFQPLLIDRITVKSADMDFPPAKPGIWASIRYFVKTFAASFQNENDREGEAAIEVWVQRNRDYVDLMQQYADEYFTPQTGYRVRVNYIPGPDMLVLANAAGKQPDVATGVGMDTPFNFALRGAIVSMNELPGFEELSSTIAPGTRIPFQYDGKDYALPEEAVMNVMFYREDVLSEHRIAVPETWDDVKKIIPTLQQNNLNFWLPPGDWLTFFYQHGVDIYEPDGADVAFDTPEGFSAFKEMTDLYVKYNLPEVIASFYQHFRLGDVPIGISSMTDYLLFRIAAPEISSLWHMAPIPGKLDASGSVVRWHGGDVKGVMMFKTTPERQAKAWEYVRWWLSAETQIRFANDLENMYGMEFRWYSAIPEVVRHTPWSPDEKDVILTQLEWFKGIPYVPGGSYMTGRELANAWTATVIDKGNAREKLENAVNLIRREIDRYRREYGLSGGSP